jgi:hypothetical protein
MYWLVYRMIKFMAFVLKDNGMSPNLILDTPKPILSENFYMKTQLTPQCLGFGTRYKMCVIVSTLFV